MKDGNDELTTASGPVSAPNTPVSDPANQLVNNPLDFTSTLRRVPNTK